MKKKVDLSKLSPKARKKYRRRQRPLILDRLYSLYCRGKAPYQGLLAEAAEIDVFIHWPPMSKQAAIAYIADCATLSREEQKENKILFQAWYILGNKGFWNIIDNFKNEKQMLERARRKFMVSSSAFHMTAKRHGEGHRTLRSCPRCIPCLRC